MTDAQYSIILSMVVPPVIKMMMDKEHWSEQEAITRFYSSKVYEALEDESLKTWHYGAATLYSMFCEERETGTFAWPEGARC